MSKFHKLYILVIIRLQSSNKKKSFLIAKLKINILYCLGLILKMLILILNYQKNNIYNKKIPASIPFIYKGLMQGFVVQSVLCERLFCALLYSHLFFFVTCAEERRISIVEHLICDIVLALRVNIAYAFFDARRESQPPSGVGIS